MSNRPHTIDGKVVDPKRAVPRDQNQKSEQNVSTTRLYVSGVREEHNEETMERYFGEYGKVTKVFIYFSELINCYHSSPLKLPTSFFRLKCSRTKTHRKIAALPLSPLMTMIQLIGIICQNSNSLLNCRYLQMRSPPIPYDWRSSLRCEKGFESGRDAKGSTEGTRLYGTGNAIKRLFNKQNDLSRWATLVKGDLKYSTKLL
jgi:hypothetical protein